MTVRDVGSVKSDLCISISDGSTCLSDQQKEEKRKRKTLCQKLWFLNIPVPQSSTPQFLNVKREDGEYCSENTVHINIRWLELADLILTRRMFVQSDPRSHINI